MFFCTWKENTGRSRNKKKVKIRYFLLLCDFFFVYVWKENIARGIKERKIRGRYLTSENIARSRKIKKGKIKVDI